MTPAKPRFSSAAASDQGPVRSNNEDRVYTDDSRGIFLVVDGMGGHEAGEHAAAIAVERIRGRLERQTGTIEQRVREAIALANNAINDAAQAKPEWNGMACVLTLAVIEGGKVTVGHVGDSRLYRLKRGLIEKVTHDHSPVGEREDRGEISEQDAMRHPRRNEVYRDVGTEQHTPDDPDFIEIQQFPFEADSALLLCSDGLSDAIPSKTIIRLVEANAADPRTAIDELIAAATSTGKDNVSVVLIAGESYSFSVGRSVARTARRTDEEDTGRQTEPSEPWYSGRYAWLIAGLLGGAILAFAFIWFGRARPEPPRGPITVNPPESIQSALERSKRGDTVFVGAGQYTGPVELKDGVSLIARPAHDAVIIGSVLANGITNARLEGFQVRDADVGIRLRNSDITLSGVDVTANRLAGIEFSGNSRGRVFGSFIHKNAGPGIIVIDSATPAIENNTITDNAAMPAALGPGLLIRSDFRPHVVGNTFSGNGAEPVWVPGPDDAILRENLFVGPKAPKLRVVPRSGAAK